VSEYGSLRWRGEVLPLTRRGRLLVDIFSGVGVAVFLYGFVVVLAFLE
jgi:hypothetical protein